MFTGIVAAVGRLAQVTPESADREAGVRVRIEAGTLDLTDVAIGDSIAIAGACMTVVALDGGCFEIDVSRESLDRTVGLDVVGDVNLEKSLRFGDRLDGHLVSGHVDGTGTVVRFEATGESHTLVVRAPGELAPFIARKGSIAIDGVSLTVNDVQDRDGACDFAINLIPHTVAVTTMKHLAVGDRVNLEIDPIARYIERAMQFKSLARSR